MRVVLVLIVGVIATLAHATAAMHVDGVPIYGRVHDVSQAEIREALKAHGEEPATVHFHGLSHLYAFVRAEEEKILTQHPKEVLFWPIDDSGVASCRFRFSQRYAASESFGEDKGRT
jgi:hypothetical protein